MTGQMSADDVREAAKLIAEALEGEHRRLVVSEMTRAKRPGKVFLDWSQNSGSKTTISPYSLRGRERPTVAAPLTWEEVEAGAEDELALEQLTMDQVLERVAEIGDVFEA
jgi:bifunctional non-homologous end joining protein LigD